MAVTSIWSIKGWIGKVINYAENPDKTKEQTSQELISESETGQLQGLNDVITYAVNAEKTRLRQSKSMEMEVVGESEELMEQYVSGLNCAPTTAREEMIAVKKRFGKEDGIVAFHGYQSFAPGECNPAMAHEIGKKLAEELWGSQYQVLIATHLDKANHLHNHFVRMTLGRLTPQQLKQRGIPVPEHYYRLPNSIPFDFLDAESTAFYEFSARIVRLTLKDGRTQLLITNLDAEQFPLSALRELYARRWGIETSFRDLKYTVGLRYFHAILFLDFISLMILIESHASFS